jgi:hypothetical protein
MRVLVVGTSTAGAKRAETLLVDAGHEVVRCHEPGDKAFPCAGLIEGRACPLESAPVDVVVTARDRPWPRPTSFEDGAVCALRRHVPLVVLGTALQPFEGWVARGVDDPAELVDACEAASELPLARHSEVATVAARTTVEAAALDGSQVSAIVHHRLGRLHVMLDVPDAARHLLSNIVAHVTTELRVLDPYTAGIDVSTKKGADDGG